MFKFWILINFRVLRKLYPLRAHLATHLVMLVQPSCTLLLDKQVVMIIEGKYFHLKYDGCTTLQDIINLKYLLRLQHNLVFNKHCLLPHMRYW